MIPQDTQPQPILYTDTFLDPKRSIVMDRLLMMNGRKGCFTRPWLESLLEIFNITYDNWETGQFKSFDSLLKEIQLGITDLIVEKNQLVRVVEIARLLVFDGMGNQLVETEQEFLKNGIPTGRKRYRPNQHFINKKRFRLWRFDEQNGLYYQPEPMPKTAFRGFVQELDLRSKNDLEIINDLYFQPRGLYRQITQACQSYGFATIYYFAIYHINLADENVVERFGIERIEKIIKPQYTWWGKEVKTTFEWKSIEEVRKTEYSHIS